jgi:hypothetical protein
MPALSKGDMTDAYHPICRAFLAHDNGRRGDASRQAHAAVEAQCELWKLKDVALLVARRCGSVEQSDE